MKTEPMKWTEDQKHALNLLKSDGNIFLTGGAGTGKSTLIQHFLRTLPSTEGFAALASTGTAAILIGGRTFHSFFGLGIMEGGPDKVVERAKSHYGIARRLRETETILIDEISMIGPIELATAERIARVVRKSPAPWGGLRVIAVGDFAQLPPVTKNTGTSESLRASEKGPEARFAFESQVWRDSGFHVAYLQTLVRAQEDTFSRLLQSIRFGNIEEDSAELLKERVQRVQEPFQGTRLFARRAQVEQLNLGRLQEIGSPAMDFPTVYMGNARAVDDLKRNAPIPEVLILKEGALVMFRQNDPDRRWVNGTQGTITKLGKVQIEVELLNGGRVKVQPVPFHVLDGEGEPLATATNFPLNLAWASTIHKAQGATLDRVHVDLTGVWEHGQTYVALSRVRRLDDLTMQGLSYRSFVVDPRVVDYYNQQNSQ